MHKVSTRKMTSGSFFSKKDALDLMICLAPTSMQSIIGWITLQRGKIVTQSRPVSLLYFSKYASRCLDRISSIFSFFGGFTRSKEQSSSLTLTYWRISNVPKSLIIQTSPFGNKFKRIKVHFRRNEFFVFVIFYNTKVLVTLSLDPVF